MEEKLKQEVLKEIRNPELYTNEMLSYIEENVDDAFNICCRKGLSLNEWKPDSHFGKKGLNQKTVKFTVRMSDLWETAIVDVLNMWLSKRFKDVSIVPAYNAKGDLLIKFPNNEEMPFEIKTSQTKSQDSFTGATHSDLKCDNYILIHYELDKEMKLKEGKNKGFIKEIAVFVAENLDAKWTGKATEKNSFTSLKLKNEIKSERPEIIVVGDLKPKTKWCGIIRKKLI